MSAAQEDAVDFAESKTVDFMVSRYPVSDGEIVIIKTEEEEDFTLVIGAVLVPEETDKQGDIVSAKEIQKAAHDFMEDMQQMGVMHRVLLDDTQCCIVESEVTRKARTENGVKYPAGTWFIGSRVRNPGIRKGLRDGTITGFSIGGVSTYEPVNE